jgi:hypothetical protein
MRPRPRKREPSLPAASPLPGRGAYTLELIELTGLLGDLREEGRGPLRRANVETGHCVGERATQASGSLQPGAIAASRSTVSTTLPVTTPRS